MARLRLSVSSITVAHERLGQKLSKSRTFSASAPMIDRTKIAAERARIRLPDDAVDVLKRLACGRS